MPIWIFALIAGGLLFAARKPTSSTPVDGGPALAADLAEIPDPTLREQVMQILWTTGPADLPALEVLASTLESKGYMKSARRVRDKIAQIKAMGGK